MRLRFPLRSWFRPGTAFRPHRTSRPTLETLEDRTLLDSGAMNLLPIVQPGNGPPPQPNASALITAYYFDLLHRQPSAQEVAGWTAIINSRATRAQVAADFITSAEYRTNEIVNDYQTILGRVPSSTEISNWLAAMAQGMDAQQATALFYASDEYFAKNGSTEQSWLTAMYRGLLGRTPDAPGLSAWLAALANGATRQTVAGAVVYSYEESGRLVAMAYQNILGRNPDPTAANWTAALQHGLTLERLDISLASSPEYVNLALGSTFPVLGAGSSTSAAAATAMPNTPASSSPRSAAAGSSAVTLSGTAPATSVGLSVGPNIDVNKEIGDQSEANIAVDPTNPLHAFIVSNDLGLLDSGGIGLMASVSTDGGVTWTPRIIADGSDGIPLGFSDPWVTWDQFGNLFLSYVEPTSPLAVAVNVSVDGGKSFTNLVEFPDLFDHPEITSGAGMIWLTYAALPTSPAAIEQIEATGAQVTGLGKANIGPFITNSTTRLPNPIPGSGGPSFLDNLGDVAISPDGQVLVSFERHSTTFRPEILVSVNPAPFNGGAFSNVRFGLATQITAAPTIVPGIFHPFAAPGPRGVAANDGLAWDRSNGPNRGRVYLVYVDNPDFFTNPNATNVFLRHSDDNGRTWSAPIQVNDDTTNRNKFFPKVSVDQTTGNVALAWYDSRNDPQSQATDIFTTVSLDGGLTFLPNVQVTTPIEPQGMSNVTTPGFLGLVDINDYGDYIGLSFNNGVYHISWADNSPILPGNPETSTSPLIPTTLDIATATVALTPGSGGGGSPNLPFDNFDPNGSPAQAVNFGLFQFPQEFGGLTINRNPDGTPNQDWFTLQTGQAGTFTATIGYFAPGNNLQLRVFAQSGSTLVELGSSRLLGSTTQTVSVPVFFREQIFVQVSPFDGSMAAYTLTLGIT
jgi:hypothetical protein